MTIIDFENLSCFLEQRLSQGYLAEVLPNLSPEWAIAFKVRLHSPIPQINLNNMACNIIHLSQNNGGRNSVHGDRTPFIALKKENAQLHISSSVNGNHNFAENLIIFQMNQTYHIEVKQRYVNSGNYRYSIHVNGDEAFGVLNTDARQFYDINVYASNPLHDPCPVYISNFKLTNFT